jgi:hypothetical protein
MPPGQAPIEKFLGRLSEKGPGLAPAVRVKNNEKNGQGKCVRALCPKMRRGRCGFPRHPVLFVPRLGPLFVFCGFGLAHQPKRGHHGPRRLVRQVNALDFSVPPLSFFHRCSNTLHDFLAQLIVPDNAAWRWPISVVSGVFVA